MLKTPLVACGLVLAMLLPAQAEISIDTAVAEMTQQQITFRISLHNMDDVAQQGPILIHLMSHTAANPKWQDVQVWNVETLAAGQGWSEEFSSDDEAALAKPNQGYEAKVWVEADGIPKNTEKLARQFKLK